MNYVISVSVTQKAAAIWQTKPSGQRSAWLSRLIEAAGGEQEVAAIAVDAQDDVSALRKRLETEWQGQLKRHPEEAKAVVEEMRAAGKAWNMATLSEGIEAVKEKVRVALLLKPNEGAEE